MDKSYLEYPKRGYGQDHYFYEWRMAKDRPKLEWSGGTKVAVTFIVPLEFFPLNPSGTPFKHPGAMVTPYPDLRHFTVRDYGNRVGVFRILEALESSNIKATFAMDYETARRYPPLLETILESGHEICAHGISTDHIHNSGLSEDEEYDLIHDCFEMLPIETKGWLSPSRMQTPQTLKLLKKFNMSYVLDWEMDQVPVQLNKKLNRMSAIPNNYELSDFTLLHTRKQTEESWLKQIKTSIDLLLEEHERFGSQMLGLTLTPYVIGQPFRIWALRALLAHIKDTDGVEVFTAGEIDKQFRKQ